MKTEEQHKNILTKLWRKKQEQQNQEFKRIFKLEEKENRGHDNSDKNKS